LLDAPTELFGVELLDDVKMGQPLETPKLLFEVVFGEGVREPLASFEEILLLLPPTPSLA